MKDRNNEIYAHIDRITDHLAAMPKQDRIAWFRRSAYVQPLNFIKEIDGNDTKKNRLSKAVPFVLCCTRRSYFASTFLSFAKRGRESSFGSFGSP